MINFIDRLNKSNNNLIVISWMNVYTFSFLSLVFVLITVKFYKYLKLSERVHYHCKIIFLPLLLT